VRWPSWGTELLVAHVILTLDIPNWLPYLQRRDRVEQAIRADPTIARGIRRRVKPGALVDLHRWLTKGAQRSWQTDPTTETAVLARILHTFGPVTDLDTDSWRSHIREGRPLAVDDWSCEALDTTGWSQVSSNDHRGAV